MLLANLNNEKELLLAIEEADEESFYILYNHFRPMLRPFIRKFAKSPGDAEDIMQEVFLKIWLSREKLSEVDNVKAWIFKIAASASADYLRKQLSYQRRLDGYKQTVETQDRASTPLEALQMEEMRLFIQSVIEKMPPARKHVFQLSRFGGKKPSEIAAILSISVGTVKNTLTAAVKQIREALKETGYLIYLVLYFVVMALV